MLPNQISLLKQANLSTEGAHDLTRVDASASASTSAIPVIPKAGNVEQFLGRKNLSERSIDATTITNQLLMAKLDELSTKFDDFKAKSEQEQKAFELIIQNQSAEICKQKQQIKCLKNKYDKLDSKVDNNLELNLAKAQEEKEKTTQLISGLDDKLSDLSLSCDLHENASQNGVLHWTIDNITDRLKELPEGDELTLHSAPSTVENPNTKLAYRYTIRAVVKDGQDNNLYLSLYFILLSSTHDNLNSFPFNQKISFMAYARPGASSSNKKVVVDSNAPSKCYARPVGDHLNPIGVENFIPLTSDYIIENSVNLLILVGNQAHKEYENMWC